MRTVVLWGLLLTMVVVLGAIAYLNMPATLRIAVGPADRDHARLMGAFAQKLQVDRAPVRLKLVRSETLAESARTLDARAVELAVVRSDQMPRDGQTLAVLHRDPVLFLVPRSSRIARVVDLRDRRLGLMRLTPENRALLARLMQQAKIPPNRVQLVEVPPAEVDDAFRDHRIDALVTLAPLQGSLLAGVVAAAAEGAGMPMRIFGIDDGAALAARESAFEAFELPRAAFGSAPAQPPDVVETVAVTHRLVARGALDPDVAGTVTRLLFTDRTALAQENPLANAIEALDPDEAAALGLHPGARAYYAGEQRSFIERYADWMYLGLAASTVVASAIGMVVGWASRKRHAEAARFLEGVQALTARARLAPDLDTVERLQTSADELLTEAVARMGRGELEAPQFATFTLVIQNVNEALARRERQLMAAGAAATAQG